MATDDRIELRGLHLSGIVGVLPHEQAQPQPLEIDLDIVLDVATAGRSDALGDTADYGALCDVTERAVATTRFQLLEALAERIAADLLAADERIDGVMVAVRKLRPPVAQPLRTSGVRITRTRPVTRAFLGLGSNLGDRVAHLQAAVAATPDVVAVSPVYETDPVGGPDDQGAYLNLVVELATPLDARGLLEECRRLETAAGRVREVRWGPRTLDVDVLWVEGETVAEPDLEVPHPRMRERRFVLAPLADLAPDLVTPAELAAAGGDVWVVGALADLESESAS